MHIQITEAPTLPPDPEEQNEMRAAGAGAALQFFTNFHGEAPEEGATPETIKQLLEQNLSDLLSNFGHFCDRQGLDLPYLLERAANHYKAETEDEKGVSQGDQFTIGG